MGIELVIVDDAPFIREAIRNLAQVSGYTVVGEAGDGEEAFELLQSISADVVIMDLVMPKKNGIDLITEILEVRPELKILVCSTESQKDMMLKALNAGCKDFIAKPFTSEGLKKKIESVASM